MPLGYAPVCNRFLQLLQLEPITTTVISNPVIATSCIAAENYRICLHIVVANRFTGN